MKLHRKKVAVKLTSNLSGAKHDFTFNNNSTAQGFATFNAECAERFGFFVDQKLRDANSHITV